MRVDEHTNVRQYSDQYQCADCGKQWDVKDEDVPPCTSMFEDAEEPEE